MKKEKSLREYEELNLVDYVKVIKKHFFTIVGITVGITLIALVLNLRISTYEGRATVLLGTIEGKEIESVEEVIDVITSSYGGIDVIKWKSPAIISISAKGFSTEESQHRIEQVINALIKRHSLIVEEKMKPLDEQIQFTKNALKQNDERIAHLEGIISRLSTFDQAQALSLQAYLSSHSDALARKDSFENQLFILTLRKSGYKQTRVLSPPNIIESKLTTSGLSLLIAGSLGLFLGLIIGIFWAFAKEWWDENKKLLR